MKYHSTPPTGGFLMPHLIQLHPSISEAFYALAAEYLPDSDPDVMKSRAALYPKAFIAAMDEDQVVGVCYGWPRQLDCLDDPSFTLAGIAVTWSYQRQGIGRQLLSAFAQAALEAGCAIVSVGSAGGYVEKFYIASGFVPTQYKVWIDGTPRLEKLFNSMDDYASYKRPDTDGFVVMEMKLAVRP